MIIEVTENQLRLADKLAISRLLFITELANLKIREAKVYKWYCVKKAPRRKINVYPVIVRIFV